MNSRWLTVTSFAFALGFAPAGCANLSRGAPLPDAGGVTTGSADAGDAGEAGEATSFAAQVHPLMTVCQQCHTAGGQAGDTPFLLTGVVASDDAATLPYVNTADPAGSPLLAKMGGHGHGGGTVYAEGSTAYATILQWIQQGAAP